jgi:hypothetical protein
MSLDALIEIASVRMPQMAEVDAAAGVLGLSVSDLCDQLSRTVAERFVQGVYSFAVADSVMNNLFGFAHAVSGQGLPALSWSVYLAFDDGEYEHPEDPPELQGEYRTRVLLAQIASLDFPPIPPEDPAWRLAHLASARAQAVDVAKQVLLGQISPVIGAQELLRLRPALGVTAADAGFQVFNLIDSESQGVPIGPMRQHWSQEALLAKAEDVRRTEQWALETGAEAFREVVTRFGDSTYGKRS